MKPACRALLALSVLACIPSAPAFAYLDPYVRVGFGGHGAKMEDANAAIEYEVGGAAAQGVPVSPKPVGSGFGTEVSAGIWLVPGLRVGGTFAQQGALVDHEFRDVYGFVYDNDYKFRLRELGFEAALRIPALAGLTLGGSIAEGRGELGQSFSLVNVHGNYSEELTASARTRTYAVFAGLDQTAPNGLAGFVQVGYHWREFEPMPGTRAIDDNGFLYAEPIVTVPADFSGWSVRVGTGFDLLW